MAVYLVYLNYFDYFIKLAKIIFLFIYQYNYIGDIMSGILFLFFAFLTVISSIKAIEYTEAFKKNITNSFFKNILLIITIGIPTLVTYLTAISINNPYMAIGNIVGSNIFNFFILALLDLYFIKKTFFNKISHRFFYINSLIVYIYIVIINTFMLKNKQSLPPTILIIIFYIIHLFFSSKIKLKEKSIIKNKKYKYLKLKFFIYIICAILFSIILTLYADYLTFNYPQFTSSVIGIFLLGITTSLPKVISYYALIKNNQYNLTVSNIMGSNMLNFLLLAITDIFNSSIYFFINDQLLYIFKLNLYINFLFYIYVIRIKSLSKITYIIPSIIIIIIYLYVWKVMIIG